jgi:hypothetical protein
VSSADFSEIIIPLNKTDELTDEQYDSEKLK